MSPWHLVSLGCPHPWVSPFLSPRVALLSPRHEVAMLCSTPWHLVSPSCPQDMEVSPGCLSCPCDIWCTLGVPSCPQGWPSCPQDTGCLLCVPSCPHLYGIWCPLLSPRVALMSPRYGVSLWVSLLSPSPWHLVSLGCPFLSPRYRVSLWVSLWVSLLSRPHGIWGPLPSSRCPRCPQDTGQPSCPHPCGIRCPFSSPGVSLLSHPRAI